MHYGLDHPIDVTVVISSSMFQWNKAYDGNMEGGYGGAIYAYDHVTNLYKINNLGGCGIDLNGISQLINVLSEEHYLFNGMLFFIFFLTTCI